MIRRFDFRNGRKLRFGSAVSKGVYLGQRASISARVSIDEKADARSDEPPYLPAVTARDQFSAQQRTRLGNSQ
jgi:hypothetical protein